MLFANLSDALIFVPFVAALVLGFTIHFFVKSRRALNKVLQENEKNQLRSVSVRDELPEEIKQKVQAEIKQKIQDAPVELDDYVPLPERALEPVRPVAGKLVKADTKGDVIASVKDVVVHQQAMLDDLLQKIELIEEETTLALQRQNEELSERVETLEWQLEKKEAELQKYKQQDAVVQKMNSRLEEANREFDILQNKISSLERQASKANHLAMELEDMQDSYAQLKKDLERKASRLEEMIAENQRLNQQVNTTEEQLQEVSLQRQQLFKKVKLLEGLNSDFHSVSETNKKLQTELRRISELESRLNMITEERNNLLRKQY